MAESAHPAAHPAAPPASAPAPEGERRPRVVIAVDLPEALVERIREAEPRVEVVQDRSLVRPRRFAADWEGDPSHQRSEDEQARYDALVDSADVLFSLPDVNPAALARTVRAKARLSWVMTMAAGGGAQLRAADLDAAELERLTVTTSAGAHGGPLAEFALLGVLAGAKDLPRLQRQQREHDWSPRWEMRQLDAMTVLVVGLGGIGTACAARFSALGARVLGTTRSGRAVEHVDELVPVEDLAAAAARADAIVATLPGTAATEGLIGAEVLGACRPGTILVNVGRGTVVDEEALLSALDDGRVGFAALDVVAREPLSADSPLWDHPDVLLSPHTAALDAREEQRIVEQFIANLHRFCDGEALSNVVDTVEFY